MNIGIAACCDALTKETLHSLLKVVRPDKAPTHNDRLKLIKEFSEVAMSEGFEKVLDKLSVDLIDQMCACLAFRESGDKKAKIAGLMDELACIGSQAALDKMKKEYISDCCKVMQISASGTLEQCKWRILGQAFEHLMEKLKKTSNGSAKSGARKPVAKVPIPECTEAIQVHQYLQSELSEFAVAHGIRKSGTKRDVCRRILAYNRGTIAKRDLVDGGKRKRGADEKKPENKKQKTAPPAAEDQQDAVEPASNDAT